MTMSSSESVKLEAKSKEGAVGAWSALLPVVSWLVFLGFGSAFLAFYYSHIHYFPELKWEESFSYLAAVTVLGGGVVAIYCLLLFVPGWIWSEFLIFDSELQEGKLCYVGAGGRNEPCYSTICKRVALPFAALMLMVHLAILADDGWLTAGAVVVGLVALTWVSLRGFLAELRQTPRKTQGKVNALLTKYVLAADVAALSSVLSLLLLETIIDPERCNWRLLLICTVSVVVSNFLVAVQFSNKPVRAILTAIIAAITLLICGEFFFSLPGATQSERILAKFGFGNLDHEVILNLKSEDPKAAAQPFGPVVLLSRLGTEYLVEQKGGERLSIPKDKVKSWSSRIVHGTAGSEAGWPSLQLTDAESSAVQEARWELGQAKQIAFWGCWALLVMVPGLVLGKDLRARREGAATPPFWMAFRSRRTIVVRCRRALSDGVDLGEALAVAKIQSFFLEHRLQVPELAFQDELTMKDLHSNLIVLGGGSDDDFSKLLSASVNATLRCGECGHRGLTVHDLGSGEPRTHHSRWDEGGEERLDDHVLIYGAPNPLHHEARMLMIFGSFGHGSWAGVHHLLDRDMPEKPFEMLLKADMCLGVPRDYVQVELRTC
jgi:hypothetical protein